jgi:hypothetical protein
MADTARVFLHHWNSDGNFKTVCPDCFKTIHTARFEVDLLEAEFNHICNPALLHVIEPLETK